MKAPPVSEDEPQRLASLHDCGVLDTESEPSFDGLTMLVARVLNVPFALVTLIDEKRQWFKSRYGVDVAETPREVSFCWHVVAARAPMVVEDAREDGRFSDNPFVTGAMGVRFYAGFPLRSAEGHVLGSLCAIDARPRTLTAEQLELMELLARQASELLEFNRLKAHQRRELLDFVERAEVPMHWLALDGTIVWANDAELALLGYSRHDYVGRSIGEFCATDFDVQALLGRIEQGQVLRDCRLQLRASDGSVKTVLASANGYFVQGQLVHSRWVNQDITQREAHESEIARHRAREKHESSVALHLIESLLREGCLDAPEIRYVTSALTEFNGDLVLAERLPDGGLRLMLGDFIGHGLPAAIGGLPLASEFYSLTKSGVSLEQLVRTLNAVLRERLPAGYFCAAILLQLQQGELTCWNGGMPAVVVSRAAAGLPLRFESSNFPLGVASPEELRPLFDACSVEHGDRVWCFSDGLIEAPNVRGELFGTARAEAVLSSAQKEQAFDLLLAAVASFSGATGHADDVSVVELCVSSPAVAVRSALALAQNSVRSSR